MFLARSIQTIGRIRPRSGRKNRGFEKWLGVDIAKVYFGWIYLINLGGIAKPLKTLSIICIGWYARPHTQPERHHQHTYPWVPLPDLFQIGGKCPEAKQGYRGWSHFRWNVQIFNREHCLKDKFIPAVSHWPTLVWDQCDFKLIQLVCFSKLWAQLLIFFSYILIRSFPVSFRVNLWSGSSGSDGVRDPPRPPSRQDFEISLINCPKSPQIGRFWGAKIGILVLCTPLAPAKKLKKQTPRKWTIQNRILNLSKSELLTSKSKKVRAI